MFSELMPVLGGRAVLITVARLDDKTLRVNVVPAQAKADENPVLATPLTYTGSPEELDADLGKHLAEYVEVHQQAASTLAEAKATMEAAAKATQEEARRKAEERRKAGQKTADKSFPSTAAEPSSVAPAGPATSGEAASASATGATLGLFGAVTPEPAPTSTKGGLAL